MQDFVTFTLNALTYIGILSIIALGLAVVFGLMDIVNMAHGEFMTIGAYTLSFVQALLGFGNGPLAWWICLFLAPLVGAGFGLILEYVVIRRLYTRLLDTILATFAVSLIIQKSIDLIFGVQPQIITAPLQGTVPVLGVEYPAYRLLVLGISALVIVICLVGLARTRFGTDLRAVIQNPTMAEALGVNAKRVNQMAFAGGSALAALAGVLVAPLASVEAHLGIFYLGKAFLAVILGGIGSILGAIAGSAAIGGAETLLNYQVDPSFASAIVLAGAIVLIRLRPRGLVPGFSAARQLLGKG
ncbi:branched-chain amino acid ABC transporter permease [Pseudooceanicola sp. C21-150M6]|uniref:branched-chain amino acid ABC transporter permease n=1 Tax=Pseudooceanicola sp. C21-150M6 TaxID=3434355 RepID=UPI003D7F496B